MASGPPQRPPSTSKTICFDLDGTLCTNTFGDYESAEPFAWAIERVNDLADGGHRIVIFTARGTATGIDWSDLTRSQLERWGVRYDELRLGKPNADVFVDDRAVHTDSWRVSDMASAPGFALGGTADGEDLPIAPPPPVTSVVEMGRTFAGRPLWLADHTGRALARADAAGIRSVPSAEAVAQATLDALAAAGPGAAELTFAISIWDTGHAGHLDLELTAPDGLHVACRPLDQASAALSSLLLDGDGGFPLVRAATSAPAGGSWRLSCDAAGRVSDALGCRLVLVAGGDAAVEPARGGELTAIASLLEAIGAEERPLHVSELDGADEILITGLPFGVVAVGTLDGRAVADRPGPVAERLARAWSDAVGVDLVPAAEAARGA